MRVAIFIDGNNFYFSLRRIYGKDKSLKKFDFNKFSKFLKKPQELLKINYYNALLDKTHNPKKFSSQKEFFSNLRKIPKFNLVLCTLLKRNIKGTNKKYYIIKEDDIHMAVDVVEGACKKRFDKVFLVSGDGDFVPAVNSAKRNGVEIINVFFKETSSRKLKNYCDDSIELNKEILDKFFSE